MVLAIYEVNQGLPCLKKKKRQTDRQTDDNPMLQKSLDNDKIKFILKNFWRLLNYKTNNVGLPRESKLRSSLHNEIPT